MDLIFWRRKKKNVKPLKPLIANPTEIYKKFLDSVIAEKSFDVSKVIECGHFGGSIIVKNNEIDAEMKIRILKKQYVGVNESEWEKINHRNFLPLLKLEYLQTKDSYLFYSSVEEMTLEEKMKDKSFRKHPQALWNLVSWLEDIADALQYLHSHGYAHMNLQAKNMIITKNDVVQVSEFHHLSSIKSRTDRFGIPQPLRSPETFFNYGGTWPVKPQPFDSWSFGIMIIELFTDFYLTKKLPKTVSVWTKEAYPVIYDVLEKYKFNRLVRKAFPKAQGTVSLKTIRHLAAYTLSFDPSKRPPAKQLHHLFIMLSLQKKFFSKFKMEFQKDKIWQRKVEWKKIQQQFESLSIEDDLELLREEKFQKNKFETESSLRKRSVLKEEKKSPEENPHATVDRKIKSGSKSIEEKNDRLLINNVKQRSKKEKKILIKTQDTIKMSYTAFTCHNKSSYETSVFDMKSVSSEISGVIADETKTRSSTIQQLLKNIENSRLSFGDISPRREMEQLPENLNSLFHIGNTSSHQNMMLNEPDKMEKEISSNSESGEETIDECKEVKTDKSIFSIGKQMMQNLIKWGVKGYETTSYSYEMSSSKNYLHSLSKHVTK